MDNILSKKNICIITIALENSPGSYSYILKNLLLVLSPLYNKIYLISSNLEANNIYAKDNLILLDFNSSFRIFNNIFLKIIYQLFISLKISFLLIKTQKKISGPVFILGGSFALPAIMSKLLKKKTVLTAIAPESFNALNIYKSIPLIKINIHSIFIHILEKTCHIFSDYLLVESPNVSRFINIGTTNRLKVIGTGSLFILEDIFHQIVRYKERDLVIGFIGRFSAEKGIINFIKAIPYILTYEPDMIIKIHGNGPLLEEIDKLIDEFRIQDKIKLEGWINHNELPLYLNKLKLLVIPSYTEGLSNIMLEAMACGTPVLATPVGGIPDIIIDSKNGFIMKQNSPECIAQNVGRAIHHKEIDIIADNARLYITNEFTYENVSKKWKNNIQKIMNNK
ncbi:MAG: glycosyltransferase [Methanomicrobiales archaeon]|nr:glycosyltransferase [Methanomicrobiales archaeon]